MTAVFSTQDYDAVSGESQRHRSHAWNGWAYKRPAKEHFKCDQEVHNSNARLIAPYKMDVEVKAYSS